MSNENLNAKIYDLEDRLVFNFDDIKICYTKKGIDSKSEKDRKYICEIEGFDFDKLTFSNQVHSDNVRVIDNQNFANIEDADAMTTNIKKLPLLIFTADCVPIVLYDIKNKVISVIHAGWKGTIKNIVKNSIDKMIKSYGTNVNDIFAIIGPSISVKNYKVSKELVENFIHELKNIDSSYTEYSIYHRLDEEYYLNLWEINKFMLVSSGVDESKIHNFEICTVENNHNFYSYRMDNKTECRIGTFVQII